MTEHRPGARRRGYDSRWQKAKAAFLEANPRCIVPACTTRATAVDHHPPHKGDKQAFWDRSRWRPMCEAHHNQQTATHDGGFGRRPTGGDIATRGCNAHGLPLDPGHPWNRKG